MEDQRSLGDTIQDFFEDFMDSLFGNERQTNVMQVARNFGFKFKKRQHFSTFDLALKSFSLFSSKHNKKIRNILTKREKDIDGEIMIFDFHIDGSLGKKSTSCLLTKFYSWELPWLQMRPKTTTEKISDFFIQTEIGLDKYPNFNKLYSLKGEDIEIINHFFTDRLVTLLTERQGMYLEMSDQFLLLYEKNKLIPAIELAEFYKYGMEIVRTILFDNSNDYV